MGLPLIQDEELHPGDLVEVEYEIQDTLNFLEDAAIAATKREVAKDPRFHYQSGRIEDRTDGFGQPYRALLIVVQVADPSKVGTRPDTTEQEAGFGGVILATAIVGLVAVAIHEYSVTYRTYTVQSIANNPNLTPQERIALAGSLKSGGSGLASLGGVLVTLGIVLAVLWGLSLIQRNHA